MKRTPLIISSTLLALGTAALMVWMYRAAGPDTTVAAAKEIRIKSGGGLNSVTPVAANSTATADDGVILDAPAVTPPVLVRLAPDKVLATVNKTPIQLRHLMPVGNAEAGQSLTPEEYDSRLQRAVDAELITQAARSGGITLNEAQQKRADAIAQSNDAEMEHYRKYGMTWKSTSAEAMEFEKRMVTAQMLEQNLVTQSSNLTPSTDPALQSKYEQARQELLAKLHTQASIAITGAGSPTRSQP
jgi:hypothetical protein